MPRKAATRPKSLAAASLQAAMRMLAEPPKRRWRAGGRDPVLDGRRARAAEPTQAEDIEVVITWVNSSASTRI